MSFGIYQTRCKSVIDISVHLSGIYTVAGAFLHGAYGLGKTGEHR